MLNTDLKVTGSFANIRWSNIVVIHRIALRNISSLSYNNTHFITVPVDDVSNSELFSFLSIQEVTTELEKDKGSFFLVHDEGK